MGRGRRLWFVAIVGIGGVAALIALGVWQVQRLAWKTELIAGIRAQLDQPPQAATGDETAGTDNFTPAFALGRFDPDAPQIRYLTSIKGVGPGFRLIAPFILENGRTILVDRGFAPEALAPRGGATPPPPQGAVRLAGVLHWPRETSSFTPGPNLADRLWFARDVPSMASALGAEPVLLALSEAPSGADAPDGADWPRPLSAGVDLPNDHLGYAITWFSLAAIWAAMTGALAFRRAS